MHYLQHLKTGLNVDSTGFLGRVGFDQFHAEHVPMPAAYLEIAGVPLAEKIASDAAHVTGRIWKIW